MSSSPPLRRSGGTRAALRALSVLFLTASAAASLAAQEQQQARRGAARTIVLGQVIDADSRAPLAGVTVRIVEADVATATGQDGQFRLTVPPGVYNVTITRLGYETALESWEIGDQSLDVGILDLMPDAVRLEALEVTADRMERMRLSVGVSSRTFNQVELATSAAANALDFITSRQSMYRVPCGSLSTSSNISTTSGGDCVRIRGGPVKICVVVDEAPLIGGFDALREYSTREIARLNVYRGGSFIQVYTNSFLAQRSNTKWQPMPAEMQMMAYCRM